MAIVYIDVDNGNHSIGHLMTATDLLEAEADMSSLPVLDARPPGTRDGVLGILLRTPSGLAIVRSSTKCTTCTPGRRCDYHRGRRELHRANQRKRLADLRARIEAEAVARLTTSEEVSRALAECLDRLGGPEGLADMIGEMARKGSVEESLRAVEIAARLIEMQRDLVRSRAIDIGVVVEEEGARVREARAKEVRRRRRKQQRAKKNP